MCSRSMTPKKLHERTKRVKEMNAVLRKLYHAPKIALNYSNGWEMLVAVQLSAQCTDERVNKVTETLFKKYPTIESYAKASQKEMEKSVFQCGFYRNKAKNIRAAAAMILNEYNGVVPKTMQELLAIPGVARKTANVVLSNLYGIHEGIAVDTHVRRFAIRFDLSDFSDPVRIERDLMRIMPQKEWWGFNHRLVHYGRDFCTARKHDCATHPLTPLYPKSQKIWPKSG